MRVTGVQTTLLSNQGLHARRDEHGRTHEAPAPLYLLELMTDEPWIGIAVARGDVLAPAQTLARELLIGEDPRAVTALWHKLTKTLASSRASQPAHAAASLLDIALWDLKSKANREPLWKTLGGSRPRVPVHASGCVISDSHDSLRDYYNGLAREYGFRAAKLHVGVDLPADLQCLALMQQALRVDGSEPALIIDVAERWSAKDAIRSVREIERHFDLAWVEAPTRMHDFLGLKRVTNAIRSAVCGGEGLAGLSQFFPHLHQRALDIIQLDTACVGITGAMQLADAAFGLELPVVLCTSPGNLNVALAGALPNVVSLEVCDPASATGALISDVCIQDGWALAGDAHGHGVSVIRGQGA